MAEESITIKNCIHYSLDLCPSDFLDACNYSSSGNDIFLDMLLLASAERCSRNKIMQLSSLGSCKSRQKYNGNTMLIE